MTDLLAAARGFCTPFYQEPQRAYHTLGHVEFMLDALDQRGVLTDPLALAVWGHDLIYDPQRRDNEAQSARRFGNWLEGQGAGAELVAEVRRLILETRHTGPPSDRTAALLVDADLSIFGADDDSFWVYERAIRQEYSFVPWAQYREGRMAVLEGFLKRRNVYMTEPHIYSTPEFFSLDPQARANLKRALRRLKKAQHEVDFCHGP